MTGQAVQQSTQRDLSSVEPFPQQPARGAAIAAVQRWLAANDAVTDAAAALEKAKGDCSSCMREASARMHAAGLDVIAVSGVAVVRDEDALKAGKGLAIYTGVAMDGVA